MQIILANISSCFLRYKFIKLVTVVRNIPCNLETVSILSFRTRRRAARQYIKNKNRGEPQVIQLGACIMPTHRTPVEKYSKKKHKQGWDLTNNLTHRVFLGLGFRVNFSWNFQFLTYVVNIKARFCEITLKNDILSNKTVLAMANLFYVYDMICTFFHLYLIFVLLASQWTKDVCKVSLLK